MCDAYQYFHSISIIYFLFFIYSSILSGRLHQLKGVLHQHPEYIIILIQYWLLSISVHWGGQFSKPGLSNLPNYLPESNYNKLALPFFDNYNQICHL